MPFNGRGPWARSFWIGAPVLLFLCSARADSLISREEALAAAFPGATVRAERIFLTEGQRRDATALAGAEVPSALIARYVAVKDGNVVGRAYVDTHVVRTKKESLLISLDDKGAVKRVEITAFLEPLEYLASPAWYGQYRGKELTGDLRLDRAIRLPAGATLTAMATHQAVRRVLAIDRVLQGAAGTRKSP